MQTQKRTRILIGPIVYFMLFLCCASRGCPIYNVWPQEMSGWAEFAKAEQNRRILIKKAAPNLEAEKLNVKAEIERTKGASDATKIENGSVTEKYIQYL